MSLLRHGLPARVSGVSAGMAPVDAYAQQLRIAVTLQLTTKCGPERRNGEGSEICGREEERVQRDEAATSTGEGGTHVRRMPCRRGHRACSFR
jgi:hypothetical protein